MSCLNRLVSYLGYLLPDLINFCPEKLHTIEISLGFIFIFSQTACL